MQSNYNFTSRINQAQETSYSSFIKFIEDILIKLNLRLGMLQTGNESKEKLVEHLLNSIDEIEKLENTTNLNLALLMVKAQETSDSKIAVLFTDVEKLQESLTLLLKTKEKFIEQLSNLLDEQQTLQQKETVTIEEYPEHSRNEELHESEKTLTGNIQSVLVALFDNLEAVKVLNNQTMLQENLSASINIIEKLEDATNLNLALVERKAQEINPTEIAGLFTEVEKLQDTLKVLSEIKANFTKQLSDLLDIHNQSQHEHDYELPFSPSTNLQNPSYNPIYPNLHGLLVS
jgi:hypothetical protein